MERGENFILPHCWLAQRSLSQNIACNKSQETALPLGECLVHLDITFGGTEDQRKLSKVGERK